MSYKINGKVVTRDEFLKRKVGLGGVPAVRVGKTIRSDALGVNPKQAEQAMQDSIKMGVPTEFDRKTGEAIFRSEKHLHEYGYAYGIKTGRGWEMPEGDD